MIDKRKIKQPKGEGICTKKRCGSCIYSTYLGGIIGCMYICYEKHSRPCKAGDDCTEYKKSNNKKRDRINNGYKQSDIWS